MELTEISFSGFRRFRGNETLRINGKLIGLVGPNEAGKSSLLNAIESLGHDDPISARDVSRGLVPQNVSIEAKYFLDGHDLEIAGLSVPSWLKVTKDLSGAREFEIIPEPPLRDLTKRAKMLEELSYAFQNRRFSSKLDEFSGDHVEDFESVSRILESDVENMEKSDIEAVGKLVDGLLEIVDDGDAKRIKSLGSLKSDWRSVEMEKSPIDRAIDSMIERLPVILFFKEDDRDLRSEYEIPDLVNGVPSALNNLLKIADVDVRELLSAHSSGKSDVLTTIEHAANRKLESEFQESWNQSGVHVSIRIQADNLLVQVVNEKLEFTSFAERSDGLRQFVALQSFVTSGHSENLILLIDEAEQRLHYDAQADLVQMLARQNAAKKVIFTTHSAGCLPEDLGNGVRLVRPSDRDPSASQIINKFWSTEGSGFAPLLFGMGASTLAFFPTRNAVVVEGPCDMLLLPTMFREVLDVEVLGFQFVPGLSEAEKRLSTHTIGNPSGVLYLTDGDDGGLEILESLKIIGISKDNLFSLKGGQGKILEMEDYLSPDVIVQSVNNLIVRHNIGADRIKVSDVKTVKRMESVENWYKGRFGEGIRKVEFAYEVLDLKSDNPSLQIVDAKRRLAFNSVCEAVLARFEQIKGTRTNP